MRIIAISFIISFHIYGVFSLRDNQVPVYYSKNSNSSANLYEIRKGKFLPFYTVVRFKNNECTATNGLVGTCYLRSECRTKQGVAFGSCSRGLGVCCVVTRNCGGLPTSSNNTYFRSPGYPDYYNGSSTTCTISIAKNRDSATHVRLTFTDFTLAQPHPTTGQCQIDRMNVLGSEISPPVICGENTGQHMYLRFTPDNSAMQIIILANSSTTFRRRWSILVTQHEQNESPPPGCLMYFTENSGQVKSFNYNLNPPLDSTRKLANQAYSACVRTNAGYCAIEWSVSGSGPFHMSGNALNPVIGVALSGDNCPSDYIIIPNAFIPTNPPASQSRDRFCGTAFPTARSSTTPFTLRMITDGEELANRNLGFSLNYLQLLCQ